MAEWEIIVDSDSLPEPQSEPPRRSRWQQRWQLLALALIALLTLGAVTVHRQRVERRSAMLAELQAVIFNEEVVRSFGQVDQATEWLVPTAPMEWQWAYRQTFTTAAGQSPPAEIEINAVDFDGQCAVVTVTLDGSEQLRTYCLHNQQWRRAPVAVALWGDRPVELALPDGIRLTYWPRDQALATALAGDLPQLFAKLERWGLAQDRLAGLEIVIGPHELHPPLVAESESRLLLNSPLLTPFPGRESPAGQVAVRLALAEALLRRSGLISAPTTTILPGAARVQAALETMVAADLLLAPDMQARLFENWRQQLDGEWTTPFLADLLPLKNSATIQQADLAAYLTAEYLYYSVGPERLIRLLQLLPAATSWDALLQAALSRSLVELEQQAAAYARTGDVAAATPPELPEVTLPLQATLLGVEAQANGSLRLAVELAGMIEPVLVEMSAETGLRLPKGESLPANCIAPGAAVEIAGSWLEIQRRVQASEVTVQQVTPFDLAAAPADTIAFLLTGDLPSEPELAAQSVFPSSRPFSMAGELLIPRELVALRQDGAIQPLMPLSRTLRVASLPIAAGGTADFLFIVDLPGCERSWFSHYEPARGVTGRWLGLSQPLQWVWRADQADLLLFESRPGGAGHNIYRTDGPLSLQPAGQTDMLILAAGWNDRAGQIVFVKRAWQGATGIGLLEPHSGAMRRAKVYINPLYARRFSPDGNWLAYLTGVSNRLDPPYRLELLNLETLAESTLVQVGADEAIGPAVWSPYLDDPRVAVLAGRLAADGLLRPTRLLVAEPDRPGHYEVAVEAAGGEELATPVFCADGGLLYRVDEAGQYRLMRLVPGQPAELLFSSNQPFRPLACQ